MKILFASMVCGALVGAGSARGEDADDPKARAPEASTIAAAPPGWEPTPSAPLAADQEDPKLQREAGVRDRGPDTHTEVVPSPEHAAPALKMAWRRLNMPNLDRTNLEFNGVTLDMYAISMRFFRAAASAEIGFGSGLLNNKPINPVYMLGGMTIGFQYPWRVTPFVDLRFLGGVIGGDVAGTNAITTAYHYGLDAGIELYLVDRLYLSAAIGWVHTFYRGVDPGFIRMCNIPMPPVTCMVEPPFVDFNGDSVTFKIGLGL